MPNLEYLKRQLLAIGKKVCTRCEKIKTLDNFSPRTKRGDRHPWCHACQEENRKARMDADGDFVRRRREAQARYRAAHPDDWKNYPSKSKERHREKDSYFKHLIAHDGKVPLSMITKEMVELKRIQVGIKRLIREKKKAELEYEHQRAAGRFTRSVRSLADRKNEAQGRG